MPSRVRDGGRSRLSAEQGAQCRAPSQDPGIMTWATAKGRRLTTVPPRRPLFLTLWIPSILFSTVAAPVCIPTNSARGFLFLQILANTCCFLCYFSHSTRCEVISHCGFDLHFPDDEWCWASFHVSTGHLYVFFGKMHTYVFCPLFKDCSFFGSWVL